MFEAVELPARVADLHACLTNVDRDHFALKTLVGAAIFSPALATHRSTARHFTRCVQSKVAPRKRRLRSTRMSRLVVAASIALLSAADGRQFNGAACAPLFGRLTARQTTAALCWTRALSFFGRIAAGHRASQTAHLRNALRLVNAATIGDTSRSADARFFTRKPCHAVGRRAFF